MPQSLAHLYIHIIFSTKKIIELTKKRSSKWIKTKGTQFRAFQWQTGYACFSVSRSSVPSVRKYIENQKEHHKKQTYKDEFLLFLEKHGIEYDERYVWD